MTNSHLKELRIANQLTVDQLAVKSGISETMIEKWEQEGISSNVYASEVYHYSNALNCSIELVCHFSNLQKNTLESAKKQG